MTRHLTINGVDIFERYKCIANEKTAYSKPRRNIGVTPINGRNGAVLTDYKNLNNVEIAYSCVIYENFRRNYEALVSYLYSLEGYAEIIDDSDGDAFRQGAFVGETSVDSVVADGGSFTLTFNCKPQKFLKSGTHTVTMAANTNNASAYIADGAEVLANQDILDGKSQSGYSGKYKVIYNKFQSYVDNGKNVLQIKLPVTKTKDDIFHVKLINDSSDYAIIYTNYSANDYAVYAFDIGVSSDVDTSNESYFTASNDDVNNKSEYSSGYIWVFVPLVGGDIIRVNDKVYYSASKYLHYTLVNPTDFTAKPIIKTYNTGYIVVNGAEIKGAGNSIIDCESGIIYGYRYGMKRNNSSAVDFMPEFPSLKSGANDIVYPRANKLEIIPRWWRT